MDLTRVGRWPGAVCICIVGVSGLLKLADVGSFQESLRAWTLLPAPLVGIVTWVVPALELSLALAWALRVVPRPVAAWGVVVFLFVVSGAYAIQVAFAHPPDCGCFGLLHRFNQMMTATWMVIARNLALMGCIIVNAWLPEEKPRAAIRRVRGPAGFTLIETVVVVCIVAVLLSLLAPALHGGRGLARSAGSLSNLRSHAGVFAAYGTDWKDLFPFFAVPNATSTVLRCGDEVISIPYFASHAVWNFALAGTYYGGDCAHPSFYAPGSNQHGGVTQYFYPCSFICGPDYWSPKTRTAGTSQRTPNKWSSVQWPTAKDLLVSWYFVPESLPALLDGPPHVPTEMAFVDGSASSRFLDDIATGYPGGDGNWQGCIHLIDFPNGLHTLGGVRGRDVPH
ncbi:MAG: prepilin-type N-terminal cleavage/methylation domain-containing protein [Gammaproteobacteria bacterium]|nr:prepilin-type N-terminal cleavage/methylation domain-containing protein [Gammaproteobacteria bacterium]